MTGCSTVEKDPQATPVPQAQGGPNIKEIKNRLNMNRDRIVMGFKEGRFNRCDFVSESPCLDNFLAIIHFRMLCRESEGTVDAVSKADLLPVQSDSVAWRLGSFIGRTRTDSDGFGQIEVIRPRSSLHQRLRLTIDGQFVATPAREAGLIVVPGNWCSR